MLVAELAEIAAELQQLPPVPFTGWQAEVARSIGHHAPNLAACFVDVDGELLIDRLMALAQLAVEKQRPIEFM
jgi:hypothetical protein